MQTHHISLSAVVPCYNEEKSLPELHYRLAAACKDCVHEDFEIILVDDGSLDKTWSIINEISKTDRNTVGVKLSRNHGHQLALTAGLSVARGDRILVIDADLQDPPELLQEMWSLMDQGADVIYGQRLTRAGETPFKKLSARWFYRLWRVLSDVDFPAESGDFRLLSRRVVNELQAMPEQYRFIRGMVSWIGYKQLPLLYNRDERFAGSSKYPLRKMIRLAIDAITGFSTRPLRIASYAGVSLSLASLAMIGYAFYGWLINDVVEGWTSVMIIVLIMGSANMLFLGLIGEYLGRLFVESKRRPLFIIDEVTRNRDIAT